MSSSTASFLSAAPPISAALPFLLLSSSPFSWLGLLHASTCSSNIPGMESNEAKPILYSHDPIMSFSNGSVYSNGMEAENDACFGRSRDKIKEFSSNVNVNMTFDDSIWAEAALSINFPVMDDPGIFASNLMEGSGWDTLQTPWILNYLEKNWKIRFVCRSHSSAAADGT
ncbi:hypothetical protein DKX38_001982 [Salix brachista]|uniref:Uncharacterized protein n=1 Tax=Salix brachista TaxID=2182728 RepID=A0A5N5NLW5_9ROSI|nr:hypothetical protein DKX38_001982 [Salix brachista]